MRKPIRVFEVADFEICVKFAKLKMSDPEWGIGFQHREAIQSVGAIRMP